MDETGKEGSYYREILVTKKNGQWRLEFPRLQIVKVGSDFTHLYDEIINEIESSESVGLISRLYNGIVNQSILILIWLCSFLALMGIAYKAHNAYLNMQNKLAILEKKINQTNILFMDTELTKNKKFIGHKTKIIYENFYIFEAIDNVDYSKSLSHN